MVIVPPGGFAGFQQMTPASKASLMKIGRAMPGRRRRKKSSSRKTRAKRGGRKGRLPKFGSPAWRKKFKLGKKRR